MRKAHRCLKNLTFMKENSCSDFRNRLLLALEAGIARQGDPMQTNTESQTPKQTRQVPTLSLRSYTEGSQSDQIRFIDNLYTGIKDYGFIILKDHDVEQSLLDHAYQLLEQFYSLPTEVKMKYAKVAGGQRGYTPFGKEHAKDSPVMDLKEFWHVGREVPANHKYAKYYPNNVWPEEIPEFKQVFTSLYHTLNDAGRTMLQALTFPLDVPQFYFDDMVEDGNSILRLLHYPPIPAGTDPRCVRAAAHEDINLITILPAATAAGLQLKDRDGSWLEVEGRPGELIVDAGDMLSRACNDVIPATTHQVINTPEAGSTSRYSMPFFMHPHPEAILSCIPSCRGTGAKYPDISSHDFLMQRLQEIGLMKK
jgi:isopenicillin N synthase-like dioxygenase